MVFTLLGMVMLVILLQESNAYAPIKDTPLEITTLSKVFLAEKKQR